MTTDWLRDGIFWLADCAPPGSWLSNAFAVKALLALTLVGLICGSVGGLVVGNRLAFFSDALAHCAFAGVTLGVLISLITRRSDLEGWLVPAVMVGFGIVVGLGIAYIRENSGLASDTVIGVFFALAVGFGAMFLAAISRSSFKDPENFLFGSPTAVYEHEILTLAALALALALLLALSYNSIMLASFNASLARSRGVRVRLWNYAFIVMLALIVNLCLRVVGALLINALLVVPAAAAANLGGNTRRMFRWGLVISVAASLAGFWLSATAELPLPGGERLPLSPSGTIIMLCVAAFFATFAWRLARDRRPVTVT
jgi:zinc transport system permease protein